ncbi:MAG: transporter substrate-binding domain-containing protein [Microcystaceae cyanobacterium]
MKVLLKALAIFTISIPFPSLAESIPQRIREAGILKVGVRQDSPLFGSGENPSGYCVDFAQKLAETLSTKEKKIDVQLIPSTTQTRWNLVATRKVDLECGPNTNLSDREKQYQIKFSRPFFVTATQILINTKASEKDLEEGEIGVIADTTNERDLRQIYRPQQIIDNYTTRQTGIKEAIAGNIQGFASDGILLIGTTMDLNLTPDRYNLITPIQNNRPFCAAYSMILPNGQDHQAWRDQVNAVIGENGKGTAIWNQWFSPFVPYMKTILESCSIN